MLQKNRIKFYPAFIWCVSHTLLSHPDFRLAVDQSGTLGTHDVLHPNYTVFHEDDHTFSDLWTAHDEDTLRSTGRSWLTWKPTATSTA